MSDLLVNCPCGSGKQFSVCHGGVLPKALVSPTVEIASPVPIAMAPPPITLKLDLAAGQNCREGFEGVDIWPQSRHVWNLMKYPWPWRDNSVLELHCSHFIEHIPMIYVDDTGKEVPMGSPGARDALMRFFDECHRVLVPEGWMTVICPCARNDRAFQDPTHRRFIVSQTFLYLIKEWRDVNKLDHYNVQCDFNAMCQPATVNAEVNLLSDAAKSRRFTENWNTIDDWIARLQKKPVPSSPAKS